MRYLLVSLLLTAFIPVSVLGHAGFQIFGIHSHCSCQTAQRSSSTNHRKSCDSHRRDHGDAHACIAQQWHPHHSSKPLSSSSESQDCVLCQFLRHAKPQSVQLIFPIVVPLLFSKGWSFRMTFSLSSIIPYDQFLADRLLTSHSSDCTGTIYSSSNVR